MGPSPPSSSPQSAPTGSSAAPPSFMEDWFFRSVSDRDTQILIQALTHELSTPPACPALPESGFAGPDSLPVLTALEQSHGHRQRRLAGLGETPAATAESGAMAARLVMAAARREGFPARENGGVQAASPPSSSSLSASNPGSPYSTITTTSSSMSIPTDAHTLAVHAGIRPEGLLVNALTSMDACIHPNSSSLQLCRGGATAALSAQAIRSRKAGKRRSRASSSRSPIHVLSTDVSNFRAIVQQLTGIPSTSSVHRHANSSIMKPPPLRNPYQNTAILPTLDTSAALLRSKPPVKDPLEGFLFTRNNGNQASGYLSSVGDGVQSTQNCNAANASASSSGISLHGQQSILNDQSRLSPSSPTLSSIWNYENDAKLEGDSPCFVQAQQFSTKQAMPPLDELAPMKAHYSPVDSWLFFDGVIANQAPHLEIARMA